PDAGTVRIACLGDSWTFGMPVSEEQTYPSRLRIALHAAVPGRSFDVENFGVLGYSSFQGLEVLKSRVLDLHPDIVVIGFGMNDSEIAGYRDKDVANAGNRSPAAVRLVGAIEEAVASSEDYKLLKYLALALKFRPRPIEGYLKEGLGNRSSG